MRKLLSPTSGATFNEEMPNLTICVRKDLIEFIYKAKPAVYIIVNMIGISRDETLLFTYWGGYFNRIQNPQVQIPKLKQCCPTVYSTMFGDDDALIKFVNIGKPGHERMEGFAISLPGSPDKTILEMITPEVISSVEKLVDRNLKMYNELFKNPPFPAWKSGLDELWN